MPETKAPQPVAVARKLSALGVIALVAIPLVANSDRDSARTHGARQYRFRVIHAYPHDPSAFTQGLEYRGGFLYEGTGLLLT